MKVFVSLWEWVLLGLNLTPKNVHRSTMKNISRRCIRSISRTMLQISPISPNISKTLLSFKVFYCSWCFWYFLCFSVPKLCFLIFSEFSRSKFMPTNIFPDIFPSISNMCIFGPSVIYPNMKIATLIWKNICS